MAGEIVSEIAAGMQLGEISKKFGVEKTNVWYIVKRKTWKHLP